MIRRAGKTKGLAHATALFLGALVMPAVADDDPLMIKGFHPVMPVDEFKDNADLLGARGYFSGGFSNFAKNEHVIARFATCSQPDGDYCSTYKENSALTVGEVQVKEVHLRKDNLAGIGLIVFDFQEGYDQTPLYAITERFGPPDDYDVSEHGTYSGVWTWKIGQTKMRLEKWRKNQQHVLKLTASIEVAGADDF